MSKLKPAYKNTTLSSALTNYLDPEQATPGTFRMGAGNLFHTVEDLLGASPEQTKERLKQRNKAMSTFMPNRPHEINYADYKMNPKRFYIPEDQLDSMKKQDAIDQKEMVQSMIDIGSLSPAMAPIKLFKNTVLNTKGATIIPGELLQDVNMFHASNADFHPSEGFRGGADVGMGGGSKTGYGGQMAGNGVYTDDNQLVNILSNAQNLMGKGGTGKIHQYVAQPKKEVSAFGWLNAESHAKDLIDEYPDLGIPMWQAADHPALVKPIENYDLSMLTQRMGADPDMIKAAEEALRKRGPQPISSQELMSKYMLSLMQKGMTKDQSRRALQELMINNDIGGAIVPSMYKELPIAPGALEWSFANPKHLEIVDKQTIAQDEINDLMRQMKEITDAQRIRKPLP